MYEREKIYIRPISETLEFEVSNVGDNDLSFEWAESYSAPDLSFKLMQEIVNFFDADDLKTEQDISYRGCETCDYGSSYGYSIRVVNAKKNNPFQK